MQQIYQLGNGNLLGLWGIDNRPSGAQNYTVTSFTDLTSGFTAGSQSALVAAYNGTNPINAGASEFDPLTYSFDVSIGDRLFDSIWLEWTGGNLVYNKQLGGGTNTMGTSVSLSGDPLAPIPLPAAAWLLIAGIGGLFAVGRRKSV